MSAVPSSNALAPVNDVGDDDRAFRKRLFTAILAVAAFFAGLFAVLHSSGINPLTDLHAYVNYAYSAVCILLVLALRRVPDGYRILVPLFLIASHATFTSALIEVVDDQFRAIWFYLLVLVAYMLGGPKPGVIMTAAALLTLLVASFTVELGLSDVTLTSMLIGLLVLSVVAQVFTNRATHYAQLVEERNHQLKALASEDPLTGILNARSYYDVGARLFKLAQRKQQPLTLLYLDVDHFKQINDRYGHYAGDQVLIQLTRTITSVLRDSDVLARIGGEEFCILLPDTDVTGGEVLAETVRQAIEGTTIELENGTLRLTASVGVTALHESDPDMRVMQDRADQNLYTAKRKGRNRVVAA